MILGRKLALLASSLFSFQLLANSITFGVGGDTIFHGQLQRQAYCMDQSSSYCKGSERRPDFKTLWKYVDHHLSAVDLMFLNLEGPSTKSKPYRTNKETESSKVFNFDEQAIFQLASSGVDIVSLANNHALDMGADGIEETIETVKRSGMKSVGTMAQINGSYEDGIAIVEKKGIRLAFIGCTGHLNGNRDRTRQVMKCFASSSVSQSHIPNPKLLRLISLLSKREDIDGVIFTPHWGRDAGWVDKRKNTTAKDGRKVLNYQRKLAREAIKYGAMTILGHHPHVLQEVEQIDGKYVFYSLGNFISNQTPWNWHNKNQTIVERHLKRVQRRMSALVYLNIKKSDKTGKAFIQNYKVLPIYMKARPEFESGSFPNDIESRNLRTLVPAIEMNPFYQGKITSIPEKMIYTGSYTFQHHLFLTRKVVETIFPKKYWITVEEYLEPGRIFEND